MATEHRVTVNLPNAAFDAAVEKRAAQENRSASNYALGLIKQDLEAHGMIAGESSERAAVLAAIEELGPTMALKVLRRAARRQGVHA